jgi:hypothetical protein
MKRKIPDVIREHYSKLGKRSAAARRKKILEQAKQKVETKTP